jgi:hypothetical protein
MLPSLVVVAQELHEFNLTAHQDARALEQPYGAITRRADKNSQRLYARPQHDLSGRM